MFPVLGLETPAALFMHVWPWSPRVQVFRTNASYARWDEGRRSFGAITTVSRDIARQVAGGGGGGWRGGWAEHITSHVGLGDVHKAM